MKVLKTSAAPVPGAAAPPEGSAHTWFGTLLLCALGLAVATAPGSVRPALIALAFAPVVEELLFRGVLQEAMLCRGQWHGREANVATALVIALAHAVTRSPMTGLLVLLPALVIGGLYDRRRRLSPCIALHAAMNLAWLLLAPGVLADARLAWR